MKLTAADRDIPVSDYDVFRLLDTLKPTDTGLDGIKIEGDNVHIGVGR